METIDIGKLVIKLCEDWEWNEKQILSFLRKKKTRAIAEFLGITSGDFSSQFTSEIERAIEKYFLNKGFSILNQAAKRDHSPCLKAGASQNTHKSGVIAS